MVILLYGNNYLVHRHLGKLREQLSPNGDDFSAFSYHITDDLQPLIEQYTGYSFFGGSKFIVVDNLISNNKVDEKEKEILVKELAKENENHLIIICAENKIPASCKLVQVIKKKGKIVKFDDLTKDQFPMEVKSILANHDLRLDGAVFNEFCNRLNFNLQRAETEAIKLKTYGQPIGMKELDALVHSDFEDKIYVLGDAIFNKNLEKALNFYRSLPSNGREPIQLLYSISRKYRQAYQILALDDLGRTSGEIASLLAMNPYPVKLVLDKRRYLDTRKILSFLAQLADLDWQLKVGSYESRFLRFEHFLVKACN